MRSETRARLERGIDAGVVPDWVQVYEREPHMDMEVYNLAGFLVAAVLLREVRETSGDPRAIYVRCWRNGDSITGSTRAPRWCLCGYRREDDHGTS